MCWVKKYDEGKIKRHNREPIVYKIKQNKVKFIFDKIKQNKVKFIFDEIKKDKTITMKDLLVKVQLKYPNFNITRDI